MGSYVNLYNPNFDYIYRSKSRKKANNSAVPQKAGGAAGGKAAKEPKATKRGASKKSSKSNNSNNAGIPQMPLDTGNTFEIPFGRLKMSLWQMYFVCMTSQILASELSNYDGTIIFEIHIMKNSSPLNLKITFCATVKTTSFLLDSQHSQLSF